MDVRQQRQPDGASSLGTAVQDAGWVRLVNTDGTLDFGRGHLKIWMEAPGPPSPSGRQAELDSFTPTALEPRVGDKAGVQPEAQTAIFPVIIRQYDRLEGTAAVRLEWIDDDLLPASLLETGGERSGERNTSARA